MSGAAHGPGAAQRRGADPQASAWVAASAGTGKTKVLIDRLLRLLLAGARPSQLLCLTFTKAAAAEMANRLARRLARWAALAEADLAADIAELTGEPPGPAALTAARRLFAAVLDAPGGLTIETIHGFCQSLLRRFPLEAGIAPHFQVMDERDARELLAEARGDALIAARDGDGGALAQALEVVSATVPEAAFAERIADLAAERGRLAALLARHGSPEALEMAVFAHLGLAERITPEEVAADACADKSFDARALRAAVRALADGSESDRRRAEAMAGWLAAGMAGRQDRFAGWCAVFLTAEGLPRQTVATKPVEAKAPGTLAALRAEAERLVRMRERQRAAATARATAALLRLALAVLDAYARRKEERALLDYDDLVLSARRLLEGQGAAAWVLYKLDGGIEHVLVDEAQDSNPDQWAVISALTGEFFAGSGRHPEGSRTVFAVGDAKQSIFGFQRADPEAFAEMRERYASAIPRGGGRWEAVTLATSFRSTAAVLRVVDQVFAHPAARDGVVAPGDVLEHRTWREGAGGSVELWPAVEPRPPESAEPWQAKVARRSDDDPRRRLARLLARRIRAMITGGTTLESRGRPVRAGDILVLVRTRSTLVEALVGEMKDAGVPVAGADRMVLTEQLAVMDLIALGHAMLLPEDDLTLACVLKGPLIGLSEEALFELAHKRENTLWEELGRRADRPPYAAAARELARLAALADRVPPHEFFAEVLGRGGRRRLLARLGPEAEDPLDEFLALTLSHERLHPPSLQGFLRWLEAGGNEIKRDMDAAADAVRIMTVHGAKGLQAPIVILPDTLSKPRQLPGILWSGPRGEAMPLWLPSVANTDAVSAAAALAAREAQEREHRRLLYVAMTRAEDHLIVCGWKGRRESPPGCWYDLVREGLEGVGGALAGDAFLAGEGETAGTEVLRLVCPQTAPPPSPPPPAAPAGEASLPAWAHRPPVSEPASPRPLAPSRPDGEEPPVHSPVGGGARARFLRGRLVHRLLQTLPDLPASRRAAAATAFLAEPAWGLSAAARVEMAGEVLAILDDAVFAPLFAAGSRAEVPLVGVLGGRPVAGQVDRLLVTPEQVLVIDYKTDRPPPRDPRDVSPLYLRQMGAYRDLLAAIYPDRRIVCALLWTEGPRLMAIADALMRSIGAPIGGAP